MNRAPDDPTSPVAGENRAPAGRKTRWRPLLFKLHRDVGFLLVGMTFVYAISGIAVNHRHQWDPSLGTTVETVALGSPAQLLEPLAPERRQALHADLKALTRAEEEALVAALAARVAAGARPRSAFWRGPDRLSLFFAEGERDTVDYSPSTGVATRVVKRDRFLLRALNFLHLNEGRRLWTWVADAFAVLLLFLALSGPLLVRGRAGLAGRGALLVAAGVIVPLVALLLLRG